jgi:hypothetical protein
MKNKIRLYPFERRALEALKTTLISPYKIDATEEYMKEAVEVIETLEAGYTLGHILNELKTDLVQYAIMMEKQENTLLSFEYLDSRAVSHKYKTVEDLLTINTAKYKAINAVMFVIFQSLTKV